MAGKDEGDCWIAKTPPPTATRAETNRTRARRRRPNPLSESASNLREDDYYHDCYWLRSTPGRIIQGLETRKAHPNDRVEQSRRNVDLESRTPSTQPENSRNDNTCLYKKLIDPRKHRPRVFSEGNKKRTPKPAKHDGAPSKRKLCKDMEIAFEPIQQPGAKSCKRSLDFTLENMEVEDQTTRFNENRSGYDPKYLLVYQRKKRKFTACSNLQSVVNRKYGSRKMQPEELIDASVKRAEYQEINNGCAQLSVNENTPITKDHLKAKLELDGQKMRGQKQLTDKNDCEASQEGGMDRERRLQQERKLLPRVESFIAQMQRVQGDRRYLPWKCSVVDSVVGAFLTQNVKDTSSSSAFMSLAAKYPRRIVDKNKPPRKNFASSTSKARKGTQVSSTVNLDCVEWNEVRSATVEEISEVIKERGMNNKIAERIKMCLDRIADEKGSIDLERLRSATPEEAKKYLMSIQGLGLKSVECIRLLTLNHPAFPVDTNIARIVVRLGWVPIEPLPEGIQMHLLNKYELHYHMITFGKAFCTKEKPNCNACPMRVECEFARSNAKARQQEKRISCSKSLITPLESKVECKQTYEVDIEDVVVDTSKAIGKARKTASVSALVKMRTEHVVYVLPNSHPLLERQDSEGPHCTYPYLLAIWTTVEGADTSESRSLKADTAEQDRGMVSGTLLIPCQRAMSGSFPLNGTYFQTNEVFADDESSRNPINVPWESIRDLTKKTLYCGTSVRNMLRGVSAEKIQQCFGEGFVCGRGFNQKTREPKPLSNRFHLRNGNNIETRKRPIHLRKGKTVKTRRGETKMCQD
ncbi:DNA glycosylase/AP lyase ROS1-like isoform X2 [Rhododendron vialii]|uniref:DNA glycosylase/AP lyase ROS1-like isoform X2 n=1 Tax=Rhododendron vialii TaxID=182163 RepID=UPI00265EDE64|nr:DNA glycosylase/AP lyase ROS1-like isoform X2 [Rhododendron vialii]